MKVARREVWYLEDSDQIIKGVHPQAWCSGQCVVHSPSSHAMRFMSLAFDVKLRSFYRTCVHGNRHQDPDERNYWLNQIELIAAKARVAAPKPLPPGVKTIEVLAMEKLADWSCPVCSCGCCEA